MELGVEVGELLKALFVYVLISTFVFVQPAEFRSAGFTLDNIFHQLLGNRQTDYLKFQLRRITLTQVAHILFVPGFFVVLSGFTDAQIYTPFATTIIQYLFNFSVLCAIAASTVVAWFSHQGFQNHYIVKKLRKQYDTEWEILATEITRELNDPFAVRAVDSSESGIYILDNWLLHVTLYNIELVKLEDARFTVVKCIEHPLSSQNEDNQIILIQVESFTNSFTSFSINLQSRNIMQLIRNKKRSGTVIAQNEKYIYQSTEDLENCFGCMAVLPNANVVSRVLARVFASEQNDDPPHFWLRRSARCPNCRNRFCVLDVLPIERQT
ncbi:hypothetical protein M3Y97_00924900 [Aphelenchoides bicaudatus]|nr:hypothetical protein M3Y97_00924900 [Aphelenchoides bicaudatus]